MSVKNLSAWCAALAVALPVGAMPMTTHAQASNDGPPQRRQHVPPYGLRVAPLNEAQLRDAGLPFGLEVTYSIALAYHCGLRLGDVIVSVNGERFDSEDAFWRLMDARAPEIRLDVRRGGQSQALPLQSSAPGCAD
ncbi:PDZ domain-containing protein [Schlegelella sp. S2-27]|uniref:PDZ domain-containing protein n=1 Tax=Caldimonas mangrovi TaxID=2944811 RepID=A0ABT0YPB9_9BURK|nr:PDZ domain-containing protein [Caldimonas mangrovi]MCM5680577.1 PDZ domain-containing protein [Caldimonas mangrovi]